MADIKESDIQQYILYLKKEKAAAIEHSLTLVTKNVRHFPMGELNIIEH